MKGSGGTEGGVGIFFVGFGLAALGVYLFFDSVYATTVPGMFGGMFGNRGGHGGGHGMWQTTSMGILFVPFVIGVIALFQDARRRWAWWLFYLGIAVIAIEVLSRVRFAMTTKLSTLLGMLVLFGAGVGLMLRSYRSQDKPSDE